jgi:hypothetical protein
MKGCLSLWIQPSLFGTWPPYSVVGVSVFSPFFYVVSIHIGKSIVPLPRHIMAVGPPKFSFTTVGWLLMTRSFFNNIMVLSIIGFAMCPETRQITQKPLSYGTASYNFTLQCLLKCTCVCRSNVSMSPYLFSTGYTFCFLHRLPEQHSCIYDHKEGGRQLDLKSMIPANKKKIGRSFHRMDSRPEWKGETMSLLSIIFSLFFFFVLSYYLYVRTYTNLAHAHYFTAIVSNLTHMTRICMLYFFLHIIIMCFARLSTW